MKTLLLALAFFLPAKGYTKTKDANGREYDYRAYGAGGAQNVSAIPGMTCLSECVCKKAKAKAKDAAEKWANENCVDGKAVFTFASMLGYGPSAPCSVSMNYGENWYIFMDVNCFQLKRRPN